MKFGLDFTVDINESAITEDLQLFYDTFSKTATKEASCEIEKFAKKEIAGYYNEYDPEYYIRTGQMRDWSYKKYNIKVGNKYREGGIAILPGFTNHEPKGISEAEIYESVWDLGLHGRRVNHLRFYYEGHFFLVAKDPVYIQGEPNRFGKIEEMVASGQFQNKMFDLGVKAAMGQKYSVLRFS